MEELLERYYLELKKKEILKKLKEIERKVTEKEAQIRLRRIDAKRLPII